MAVLSHKQIVSELRGEVNGAPIIFRIGDVWIDRRAREVSKGSDPIRLGPETYKMFQALACHACRDPEEPMAKSAFLEETYGGLLPDSNSPDVLLAKLRKKLKTTTLAIKTFRRVGYKLVVAADGSKPGIYAPE
jgi:DNA-binding response OmpR family regulator